MIDSIRLENFQAHKDTLLELHPGVNVIAGSSNSGKSSILRALNWLIYNRPSGEAFVSHWARDAKGNQKENTSVTVRMGELQLQRKKTKSTGNSYVIGEKVLEAIGLDVPEEVTKALNLSEVNTQRQHDAPFLLSESPGEVARFFNKIVHFDAIDKYLSSIESKKRKAKADAESGEENAKRLENSIAKYCWMEKAEELLEKIQTLEKSRDAIDDESLEVSTTHYRNQGFILATIESVLGTAMNRILRIEAFLPDIIRFTQDISQLEDSCKTYRQNKAILDVGVDTEFADKVVRKIERKRPLLTDLNGQYGLFADSINKHKEAIKERSDSTQEIATLTLSLPSVCPTCGKEL